MPVVEDWRLLVTNYGPEAGQPTPQAFSNADRYESLGDAISATADVPPGQYSWIYGEGILFTPDHIRPLRKLQYRPGDV
jgi:hypothetical protein